MESETPRRSRATFISPWFLSELFGFVLLLLLRSVSRWALEPIYLSLGTGRGQSADTYLEFNFELVKKKQKAS